jgi:hypothetical protein
MIIVNVNDVDLMVERVSHSGHYVISAMVVDQYDNEFLHSIQFWGYDEDDFEDHPDMIKSLKESYLDLLRKEKLALS